MILQAPPAPTMAAMFKVSQVLRRDGFNLPTINLQVGPTPPGIPATALPGGQIILSKLLAKNANNPRLLYILTHELLHQVQGGGAAQMAAGTQMSPANFRAMEQSVDAVARDELPRVLKVFGLPKNAVSFIGNSYNSLVAAEQKHLTTAAARRKRLLRNPLTRTPL